MEKKLKLIFADEIILNGNLISEIDKMKINYFHEE